VCTYTGDANNNPASSNASISSVLVALASPAINGVQQPTSAIVGATIACQCTVSGGDNPTGTITFNLYNNNAASGVSIVN